MPMHYTPGVVLSLFPANAPNLSVTAPPHPQSNPRTRSPSITTFTPPNKVTVQYQFPDGGSSVLELYATPTKPGECMHAGRQVGAWAGRGACREVGGCMDGECMHTARQVGVWAGCACTHTAGGSWQMCACV